MINKEDWIKCFNLFISIVNNNLSLSAETIDILSSDIFLEFCQFHRVIPLVFPFIKQLCQQHSNMVIKTEEKLQRLYYENLKNCLKMQESLLKVVHHFEKNNIKYLVFKGNVLSQLLYDCDYTRQFKDLDILVAKNQVDEADAILLKLGYQKTSSLQCLSPWQKKMYMRYRKDFSYYHPVTKVCIELHWHLSAVFRDEKELFWQSKEIIYINDVAIPTLTPTLLFIYLCMHGTYSFWRRLQWLIDIKSFYTRYKEILNWDEILQISKIIGFDRCIGQAFYLLKHLFQLSPPLAIDLYIQSNKKIPKLANYILQEYQTGLLNDKFFTRFFCYYLLAFRHSTSKKMCFYPLLISPLFDNKFTSSKKPKISTIYYLLIKLPAYFLHVLRKRPRRSFIKS